MKESRGMSEFLSELFNAVKDGSCSVQQATEALGDFPFQSLGHTRIDTQRELRCGFEEVVYGTSKKDDALLEIIRQHIRQSGRVLVTRLDARQLTLIGNEIPEVTRDYSARVAFYKGEPSIRGEAPLARLGRLGIVSAGTSDQAVADEAQAVAEYFNFEVLRLNDAGVAGLPRLLAALPELRQQDALIAIAGMEGALPSVLSGLVPAPVIAVPTSVGYGASLGGVTALLSMLVSCSPGVSVVNIDNGFGAVLVAAKFVRQIREVNGGNL